MYIFIIHNKPSAGKKHVFFFGVAAFIPELLTLGEPKFIDHVVKE